MKYFWSDPVSDMGLHDAYSIVNLWQIKGGLLQKKLCHFKMPNGLFGGPGSYLNSVTSSESYGILKDF